MSRIGSKITRHTKNQENVNNLHRKDQPTHANSNMGIIREKF